MVTAKKNLEADYDAAIKDLTKVRADKEAERVEDELREFQFSLTSLYREFSGKSFPIVNRFSGKVLCPRQGSDKEGVDLFQWDVVGGERAQLWTLAAGDETFNYLSNAASKKLAGRKDGSDTIFLTTRPDGAAAKQHQWRLTAIRGLPGHYIIMNRASGKFLTVTDKNAGSGINQVRLRGQWGGPEQHWKIEVTTE